MSDGALNSTPTPTVTHDQCDARPTVTFQAARHHRPVTNLYCLVTDADVFEGLAQVVRCYLKALPENYRYIPIYKTMTAR